MVNHNNTKKHQLEEVNSYKYLGVILNKKPDYDQQSEVPFKSTNKHVNSDVRLIEKIEKSDRLFCDRDRSDARKKVDRSKDQLKTYFLK